MTDQIPLRELDSVRPLSVSLGKAAATTAARSMTSLLHRKTSPDLELPAEGLSASGLSITGEAADAYHELFGHLRHASVPSVAIHIAVFPVAMQLMTAPDFPLPLLGLVHTKNSVHHVRPIPVGQDFSVHTWAEQLVPHRVGTTIDIIVQVLHASSGELLWHARSEYLARGVFLKGAQASTSDSHRTDFIAPRPTAQWRLAGNTGRRYAHLSGDYNPIHLQPLAAKALGMKGTIAHGMYLAGRMLAGREPLSAGHHWSISFATPVVLPATVNVNYQQGEDGIVHIAGWNPRRHRPHFIAEVVVPQRI